MTVGALVKIAAGFAVTYAAIGAVVAVVVYTGLGKLPDPPDEPAFIDWDEPRRWVDTRSPGPL